MFFNLPNSFLFIILVLTLYTISKTCFITAAVPPAIFIFGDSLLDVGNNNYIKTRSQANKKPFGIDFVLGPTGRYTNGRTIIDIVGRGVGVKGFIPPFLAPTTKGRLVLKGVNYASGSSGILNETGKPYFKMNIFLDSQIDGFARTRQTIIQLKGKNGAKKLLRSNSLFTVAMGSNDMLNNYLVPFVSWYKQRRIPPRRFISILINKLREQLVRLYKLDARKFIVTDLSPIGCVPFVKDTHFLKGNTNCYEPANKLAQMYNSELRILVNDLRNQLNGSAFVYVHIYDIFSDITRNYKSYGFEKNDVACCRLLGKRGGLWGCGRFSHVCRDRKKYIFWDSFHPTEAAYLIIARRMLNGVASEIEPMNIRQLVKARTY